MVIIGLAFPAVCASETHRRRSLAPSLPPPSPHSCFELPALFSIRKPIVLVPQALELASVVVDGLAARPLPPYLWPDCRVVDLASRNMRAGRATHHVRGDYDADRAGAGLVQPRSLRQACGASRGSAASAAVSNGHRTGQREAYRVRAVSPREPACTPRAGDGRLLLVRIWFLVDRHEELR